MPMMPPIDYLKECLDYDPQTGILRWKERPRRHFSTEQKYKTYHAKWLGKPAGSERYDGQIQIRLNNKSYMAHRLAWAIHYGEYPKGDIRHIDGHESEDSNRISNLMDDGV